MNQANKIEMELLKELNDVVGIDKEMLSDYARYIALKASGDIIDIGNSNFMFKCPSNFLDSTRIIEIICKVITYHYENLNCYEIKQRDIRHLSEIDADVIIIDAINNLNIMMSTLDALQEYIYTNNDKIFILVYAEDETVIKHNRTITTVLGDFFSFKMQIGTLTEDDKIEYIKDKLEKNKIKVAKHCDLVNELASQELSVIDNELLYLAVKYRVNNVDRITDDFLQKVNRPQYISAPRQKEKTAMQELDEMIGLESVKQQIKQIINYVRTSKNRNQLPMLHFAFLGNSGCGKTEVARLVARIFADEGILPSNEFIEAQRCDLVAGYIGQTSLKTQSVINKALGSTLYIDEAYAIAPTSQRDFGNECIATLIKAMEDHRDNLSVILSGYTQDMEELLKTNRGFSSRVPFKIYFPDYTSEELYSIFKKMIKEDGYKLDKGVKQLLLVHFINPIRSESWENSLNMKKGRRI